MKKLDFAEYIRITERVHERDGMKNLNAHACTALSGEEYLAICVIDRKSFGDETLTDIVRRLCGRSILKDLKVKEVDESRNAVEFVFKNKGGAL